MAQVEGKAYIIKPLRIEYIEGSEKYVKLIDSFVYYSGVLRKIVTVPSGMICDLESIPLLRGTGPEAGVAHDHLCRKDSIPNVSKAQAARVYRELLDFLYSMDDTNKPHSLQKMMLYYLDRSWDFIRKWVKYSAVYIAPGYFHRYNVLDSYEVISS